MATVFPGGNKGQIPAVLAMGAKAHALCKQAQCHDVEEPQIWLLFCIDFHILGMGGYSLLRCYRLRNLPLLPAFGVGYIFDHIHTFKACSDNNTHCCCLENLHDWRAGVSQEVTSFGPSGARPSLSMPSRFHVSSEHSWILGFSGITLLSNKQRPGH